MFSKKRLISFSKQSYQARIKQLGRATTFSLFVISLIGCGQSVTTDTQENEETIPSTEQTKQVSTDYFKNQNFKNTYDNISISSLQNHIKYLSSDELKGREPGSEGDRLTADYLRKHFKDMGLQPGNGDSFLQSVELLSIDSKVTQNLKIADISFTPAENFVANTRKKETQRSIEKSELVFVGYGINAPEFGWNDYAGLDVNGKTVVILVNDPGYATGDPDLFSGNTLTYYGRWTYKFEEAGRQGAKAAIIIHETKPASYGWGVIKSSWTGTQYHLPRNKKSAPVVDIEMWINIEKTNELFSVSGLDFQKEKLKAQTKGFEPVPLNLNASVEVTSDFKVTHSNNIVATLPGTESADEHVIYMAHVDHLGQNNKLEGDQIYNGAHDNASGAGGLIEIARSYSNLKIKPKRSITFVGAAAEEQGTLGSKYFANNSPMPLSKIVGLVNMDSLNITGRKKDVSVVGYGKSELEDTLKRAAKLQNRSLTPETHPERGYYFRSDHFSLAKIGVPGLSAGGGTIPLNDVEQEINDRISKRVGQCYHQLCDEYADDWGWDGTKEDLQLYFTVGYMLANENQWPNWNEGTEFKLLRDKMMSK